jgi:hypothetical protein
VSPDPRTYRLFVASPGDVRAEREALERVVAQVNDTHGDALSYRLDLLRWETDAVPGAGRPQQVINDQIGAYDVFVGIMWKRFGTSTGVADSGTEEEYRIAYGAWERNPDMPLMFYFCQTPFMPREVSELEQMRKVLEFRKELEGKALVWNYDGPDAFEDEIFKHLCKQMKRLVQTSSGPGAVARDSEVLALRTLWDRMDPALQKAFSVAYNENRMGGDGGIQTRDLFAALLRVRPSDLAPIVDEIPAAALPEPTGGPVTGEHYIVDERPWLSHCVSSSIGRLTKSLPPGATLHAADVFADIAKHGTGESVRLLRDYHIGPDEIDRILARKNITVVAT